MEEKNNACKKSEYRSEKTTTSKRVAGWLFDAAFNTQPYLELN